MEALDLETLQENAPTSLPIEGQLLLQVTAELHKNKERTDIVRWKLLVDSSLKSLKLKNRIQNSSHSEQSVKKLADDAYKQTFHLLKVLTTLAEVNVLAYMPAASQDVSLFDATFDICDQGASDSDPFLLLIGWKFLTTASNSLKNHPRIPFLMKKILESMESNCAKFFSPFQVVDSVSHRKGKQTFVFSTALIITTGMLDNLHKLYPSSLAKLFLTSLNTLVKQHGGLIAAIGNESIPKILLFCCNVLVTSGTEISGAEADLIFKGINSIISCYMHYDRESFQSSMSFLHTLCSLTDESIFSPCSKMFIIGNALRFIEQPANEDFCNNDIVSLLYSILNMIEGMEPSSFCQPWPSARYRTLHDVYIVGVLCTIYSFNQATWQGIEVMLWKYLASSEKVHVWSFCVDLFGNLAEKGLESLIEDYVLEVIPSVISQAACSKLNSRLAFLSDTLVCVSRRLAISINAERTSQLIARVGVDLYESRDVLLILYHQFTSGYLWGCVPKDSLLSLISNFSKMKLFDALDFRKFQCLYLAIGCLLSLSKFYQDRAISCPILDKLMYELRARLPLILSTSLPMLENCASLQKSPHHIRQSVESLITISLSVDRAALDPAYVDNLFKTSISLFVSWTDSSLSRDLPWFTVLHFLIYYADRLCLDQARTTKVLDYLLSFTHDRVVLKKALETVQLLFKGGYVKGKLSDLSKLRMKRLPSLLQSFRNPEFMSGLFGLPLPLLTDSYKTTHPYLYPNAKKMTAYGEFRQPFGKDTQDTRILFYGIRYLIETHVGIQYTKQDVELAASFFETHCAGATPFPFPKDLFMKFVDENNGYFPVVIKSLPEGSVIYPHVPVYQVTAENEYSRLVTYLETILTMIWYPTTVATLSRRCLSIIKESYLRTVDKSGMWSLDSRLHDFGFRGCTSVEQSIIGGVSHLVNFSGTDTLTAAWYAQYKLNNGNPVGYSIPATEHSIMTAFKNEKLAMTQLLENYGSGVCACVMDSYDYTNALESVLPSVASLKTEKGGFLVLRPDSGDPVKVVVQALKAADKIFGSDMNGKGFKVLRGVGVIQGDGINIKTIADIAQAVEKEGYSAENVAYGMGGGLLQKVDRDTMSFATKLSKIVYEDGTDRDVMKMPQGSSLKRSLPGEFAVFQSPNQPPIVTPFGELHEGENILTVVYDHGPVMSVWDDFTTVRKRASSQWDVLPKTWNPISESLSAKIEATVIKQQAANKLA